MIDTEKGADEEVDEEEPELKEIEIEDIAVGTQPKANNEIEGKKKQKANNTASQTRDGKEQEKQFDDLLDGVEA